MPPTNVHSDNENEIMAVRASQAAAQKMMKNDSKRYRDHIQATTNTYGWNTVETGVPIPAMPTYPAPLQPHQNIKLPLQQKLNKSMNIYTSNGFSSARQYLINTKANIQYTKNQLDAKDRLEKKEYYTPEWILAKERVKHSMQKKAKNRNNTMKTLRSLTSVNKPSSGGRKQRKRKTLRKRNQ